MTENKKPKIAIVGCGYWGKNLVRNYYELDSLACICDSDINNVKAITDKYTVESREFHEVLKSDDVDGVVISAPAETHYKLALEVLQNNKHVFVEKPLSLDYEEASELVKLAESKGLVLMVGHLLQYHPAFIRMRDYIKEGNLGDLQYIYSNRLSFGKLRKEENILWSFAPHDISMILSVVNSEPVEVSAVGSSYINNDIADVTTTHMKFADNINAHVFVSWLHPHKEQKMVVIGSEGMAIFDDQKTKDKKVLIYPHKVSWQNDQPLAEKSEAISLGFEETEPLKNECQHFIDCIQGNTNCITDGYEGLRVLKVLNSAQKSLDEHTS
tara:strand:+ start:619 stop:1599 length:981 start_codon:yes stop_codon:yes gene_type:complete